MCDNIIIEVENVIVMLYANKPTIEFTQVITTSGSQSDTLTLFSRYCIYCNHIKATFTFIKVHQYIASSFKLHSFHLRQVFIRNRITYFYFMQSC